MSALAVAGIVVLVLVGFDWFVQNVVERFRKPPRWTPPP